MPRDPEPLQQVKKPELTRAQAEGIARHKLTQICGLTRYEIKCSCGKRSGNRYRIKNGADALKAQDFFMAHLYEVARDLGISPELVQ